jgi:hypothetical protein
MATINKKTAIRVGVIFLIIYGSYSLFIKTDIHLISRKYGAYVISNVPQTEIEVLDFLAGKYPTLVKANSNCAFYEETLEFNRFNWLLKYFGFKDYLDDSKPEFADEGYFYLQEHKIGFFSLAEKEQNHPNPFFIVHLEIRPPFDEHDLDYSLRYYPNGFKNGKYHWVIYSFEYGKATRTKYNLYKDIWKKFGFENDPKKYPNLVFD